MPKKDGLPVELLPYTNHGLDVSLPPGGKQATADCPWCDSEGKFTIEAATGRWRCFSCNEGEEAKNKRSTVRGGNSLTFLRLLWLQSHNKALREVASHTAMEQLRQARGLLSVDTLWAWKMVPSLTLAAEFIVPAYKEPSEQAGPEDIVQLYRWGKLWSGKKRQWEHCLQPTAGHGQHLLGLHLFEDNKPEVWVMEGWGDALAMWEAIQDTPLIEQVNVVAAPSCNTWKEDWGRWLAGKRVTLFYDSDWPREGKNGQQVGLQGYRGLQDVVRLLYSLPFSERPLSMSFLCWGDMGFDPDLNDGYDVRDWLTQADGKADREQLVERLLAKVLPVPNDWTGGETATAATGSLGIDALPCQSWREVRDAWHQAYRMRQDLEDMLSCELAVCLSTDQVGTQLFLQVIGDASSGKTKVAEALLVSPQCMPVDKIKGFLSGWRSGMGDDDYSLLYRGNHRTWVTAEGDLLFSNTNFSEIMSEIRRAFDGNVVNSCKTLKEDRVYAGLRTPWIIVGTPALLNRKDAHLGDRFIRFFLDKPDAAERRQIQLWAARQAERNTLCIAGGDAKSAISPEMLRAYQLTGGYVDYLRSNVLRLTDSVERISDRAVEMLSDLGDFAAKMRSRPDPNPDSEMVSTEEPTRLTEQFVRLAKNLAAVWQRGIVDDSVLRLVRKITLDTSAGHVFEVCRRLYGVRNANDGPNRPKGLSLRQMAAKMGEDDRKMKRLLVFLHKIGVTTTFFCKSENRMHWRLSESMLVLWDIVVEGQSPHTVKVAAATEEIEMAEDDYDMDYEQPDQE